MHQGQTCRYNGERAKRRKAAYPDAHSIPLPLRRGVSVSRLVDSKHAAGDIACGALLGATVGLAFVLRAIPRHYRLMPAPKPSAQRPLLSHGGEDTPPTSLAHELPA